jgi:hypothetical protein
MKRKDFESIKKGLRQVEIFKKRVCSKNRPIFTIIFSVTEQIHDDMNRVALSQGLSGIEPLIRDYIEQGLQCDLVCKCRLQEENADKGVNLNASEELPGNQNSKCLEIPQKKKRRRRRRRRKKSTSDSIEQNEGLPVDATPNDAIVSTAANIEHPSKPANKPIIPVVIKKAKKRTSSTKSQVPWPPSIPASKNKMSPIMVSALDLVLKLSLNHPRLFPTDGTVPKLWMVGIHSQIQSRYRVSENVSKLALKIYLWEHKKVYEQARAKGVARFDLDGRVQRGGKVLRSVITPQEGK